MSKENISTVGSHSDILGFCTGENSDVLVMLAKAENTCYRISDGNKAVWFIQSKCHES